MTAGHLVHLIGPLTGGSFTNGSVNNGEIFKVYTSSVNSSKVKPKYFLGSLGISKETPNTFNRSDWGFHSEFDEYFWLPGIKCI